MITPLLLALACVPQQLSGQESWELLGVDQVGDLIDFRVSRSETGLLRGGGRSRLAFLSARELPLEYGRAGAPDEVSLPQAGGLSVGPDGFIPNPDGLSWAVNARAEDFSLRLTLTPTAAPARPLLQTHEGGQWQVEAPVTRGELQGFIAAGTRQELIDGDAVLIRRLGDAPPALRGVEHVGVYVISPELSLGVDQTGLDVVSWIVIGDRVVAHDPGAVTRHEDGGFSLDFRPSADVQARVRPLRQPRLASDPLDHLLLAERLLLRAVAGTPTRRVRAAKAELLVAGVHSSAPALTVVVSYE